MMKKTHSPSPSIDFSSLFGQLHLLIFFLLLVGGLIYAVLSLGDLITSAQNGSNAITPSQTNINSSQSTIDAINKLHASNQTGAPALPGGRLNPFGE